MISKVGDGGASLHPGGMQPWAICTHKCGEVVKCLCVLIRIILIRFST
jgi:hypothetical protein